MGALCFVLVDALSGRTGREVAEVEARESTRTNQCRISQSRQARSETSHELRVRKIASLASTMIFMMSSSAQNGFYRCWSSHAKKLHVSEWSGRFWLAGGLREGLMRRAPGRKQLLTSVESAARGFERRTLP